MALRARPEWWTLVVIGAWNVRIFTPEWVARELFQSTELTTEVGFTPSETVLRFSSEGVDLVPQDGRILVAIRETSAGTVRKAERVMIRLLELLPHTPISALGVNFGFQEPRPSSELLRVFRAADHGRLSSDFEVKRIELVRTLTLDPGALNLKHVLDEDQVEIHFNYHYAATTTTQAATLLEGLVERQRQATMDLLASVYDLQVEEEEHNDHRE